MSTGSRTWVLALALAGALALFAWRSREATHALEPRAQSTEQPASELVRSQPTELAQAPAPESVRSEAERVSREAPTNIGNAANARIEVDVVAQSDGRAIAGARVQASSREGALRRELPSATSDAHGRATFDVAALAALTLTATFDVHGGKSAIARARATAGASGTATEVRLALDVSAPASGTTLFFGRVVDAELERPIAGAKIARIAPPDADEKCSTTDADGVFSIECAAEVSNQLSVEARGFGHARVATGTGHASAETAQTVRITPGARLIAWVRGQAGARVELWAYDFELEQHDREVFLPPDTESRWAAATDAAGRAEFDDLPANVALHVALFDARDAQIANAVELQLAPREERTLELAGIARGAIEGVLLDDDGRPIPGEEIWIEPAAFGDACAPGVYSTPSAKSTTDARGAFRFANVGEGSWSVAPRPLSEEQPMTSDAIAGAPRLATIGAADAVALVELHASRGLAISGRVVDPNGQPLARAIVSATGQTHGLLRMSASTGSDGLFTLGPLQRDTYAIQAMRSKTYSPSESQVAKCGDAGLVLVLKPGCSIRGIVLGANGASAAATVHLAPTDPGDYEMTGESTDADDGEFAFEGLACATYELFARGADATIAHARVTARAQDDSEACTLTLEHGATIALSYGGTRARVTVLVRWSSVTCDFVELFPRGERRVVVPAGSVTLELDEGEGIPHSAQSCSLAAGETRSISFDGQH